MKLNISLVKPLIIASSVALAACSGGGGGSDDGGDTVDAAGSSRGLFVDAEVEGLSYTTSSGVEGVTDENGTYNYTPGDEISFSVGGVDIGTVTAAPKCTPTDFGAAKLNIARFIQSLDADGDPTNGIDLVAASAALAGTTISSDAFNGDDATFAANADIAAALATTGDTLLDAATAQANLDNGTDATFSAAELEGNTFVVIVPGEDDLGIISFSIGGQAVEVFIEDTTIGGGDGSEFPTTWTIDPDGVLVQTASEDGEVEVIRVTRVGGSSRAISVNVLDAGETEAIPVTLLIPQLVTAPLLGGTTSKTYDVITTDGTPLEATFNSDGTFTTDEPGSGTGTYKVVENVISIDDSVGGSDGEITSLLLLGDFPAVVGQSANLLFVETTEVGGSTEYNEIGIGSLTLK